MENQGKPPENQTEITMNPESRYVTFARLAYQLAQRQVPLYSHPKSPKTFTQPQLVACVLLMEYMKYSYRDIEQWLLASDAVRQVLDLKRVPDHSTLSRAFQKLKRPWLDGMNQQLLHDLAIEEDTIAADSTSFSLSQASRYYVTRTGKKFSDWIKGGYAVGCRSLLIVGWCSAAGRLPDFGLLHNLKRQAARFGRYIRRRRAWWLLTDKGFDAGKPHPCDVIPPIRRNGKLKSAARRMRDELVAALRLDGLFGQRWKVETVHSVIKRKWGDTIRSRLSVLQRREPILKGLVYNIHVV
jgi:transposase-like protein DUF772